MCLKFTLARFLVVLSVPQVGLRLRAKFWAIIAIPNFIPLQCRERDKSPGIGGNEGAVVCTHLFAGFF